MPGLKSESWIIIELTAILLVLAGLSCFFVPAYEKGFWYIIGVIGTALGMVMGYKFGRSMPQQAANGGAISTPQPGNGGSSPPPEPRPATGFTP